MPENTVDTVSMTVAAKRLADKLLAGSKTVSFDPSDLDDMQIILRWLSQTPAYPE